MKIAVCGVVLCLAAAGCASTNRKLLNGLDATVVALDVAGQAVDLSTLGEEKKAFAKDLIFRTAGNAERALERLEKGDELTATEYFRLAVAGLHDLAEMLRGVLPRSFAGYVAAVDEILAGLV